MKWRQRSWGSQAQVLAECTNILTAMRQTNKQYKQQQWTWLTTKKQHIAGKADLKDMPQAGYMSGSGGANEKEALCFSKKKNNNRQPNENLGYVQG